MKGAYKQFAASPLDAEFNVVSAWDVERRKAAFFRALALMFGATGAVYGFNRCSLGLRSIVVRLLWLAVSSFFDDFPQLEFEATAQSAAAAFDGVCRLLGWGLKEVVVGTSPRGEEVMGLPSFDKSFVALGGLITLGGEEGQVASVGQKPGRIADLSGDLDRIEERARMTAKEAEVLRGKVRYAACTIYGRCGAVALRALGQVVARKQPTPTSDPSLGMAIRLIRGILGDTSPRVIPRSLSLERPTLIFSDGACDDDGAVVTVGALLWSPRAPRPEFFHWAVPEEVKEGWRSRVEQKQLIHQAELFPVWAASRLWGRYLTDAPVLRFIDNDAARYNLIGATGRSEAAAALVQGFWQEERMNRSRTWFDRVESSANPGDDPSRGKRGSHLLRGVREVDAVAVCEAIAREAAIL